jgi:ABC-2 type transport system permease protein
LAAIKEVLKVSNLANLEGLNNSLKNMTITTISNSITMIGTLLGLVYVIILSNSLIASKVDRGSMAYILSTPIRRFTVSYTQSIFAIGSLLLMVIIIYISQFIVFIFTGVTFDYLEGAISYFGFFLFLCAISSIAFLASCVSNTSKNCLTFGGGIPVVFYVLTIISQINVDLSFVRFFTLNTLFAKETIQNI